MLLKNPSLSSLDFGNDCDYPSQEVLDGEEIGDPLKMASKEYNMKKKVYILNSRKYLDIRLLS